MKLAREGIAALHCHAWHFENTNSFFQKSAGPDRSTDPQKSPTEVTEMGQKPEPEHPGRLTLAKVSRF